MVTFGYAIKHNYTADGTLQIQVRIPSIHGPFRLSDYGGQPVRNYTAEEDLPFYPSLILPHLPRYGDVVALTSLNEGRIDFMVMGLTGGSHSTSATGSGGPVQ